MKYITLCIVVVISVLGAVLAYSAYEDELQVHHVVEGKNLLIVCDANQTSDVEIFWLKNDTGSTFRQNGTYLTFVSISRTSAGEYVCYSYNLTADNETESNATVVEAVEVDVQYHAEITKFEVTPKTVTENHTFDISCTILGNPAPKYSIQMDAENKTLISDKGSGTVTVTSWNVTCEDAGYWICTGYNRLNKQVNVTKGDNITVLCGPRPDIPSDMLTSRSRPGHVANFTMISKGYPYPNYTWTHDGVEIPRQMQFDDGSYSYVNFTSVEIADFGTYTLTMTNFLGTYVASYQLVPYGPSIPPTNLTYTDITHEGVTLHWISHFDMWNKMQFWIDRMLTRTSSVSIDSFWDNSTNHGVGNHLTYVVRGLQPLTHYEVVVAAENPAKPPAHLGYIGYTNHVNFTTKASPTTYTTPPASSDSPHISRAVIIQGQKMGALAFLTVLILML